MKKLFSVLTHSAIYTLVFSLFLCLFAVMEGLGDSGFTAKQYLLLFAFSLVLACLDEIVLLKFSSTSLRRTIHFVLTLISFLVFCSISGKIDFKAATVFLLIIGYILGYIVFFFIKKGISHVAR